MQPSPIAFAYAWSVSPTATVSASGIPRFKAANLDTRSSWLLETRSLSTDFTGCSTWATVSMNVWRTSASADSMRSSRFAFKFVLSNSSTTEVSSGTRSNRYCGPNQAPASKRRRSPNSMSENRPLPLVVRLASWSRAMIRALFASARTSAWNQETPASTHFR